MVNPFIIYVQYITSFIGLPLVSMVMMVMYDLFHCAAKIGSHTNSPKMILKNNGNVAGVCFLCQPLVQVKRRATAGIVNG